MRHLALVPTFVLALAGALPAQSGSVPPPAGPVATGAPAATALLPRRFLGWDRMREQAFRFDPDQRDVLGFSVHATPASRAALEAAEAALAAGEPREAARRFAGMVAERSDDVLQVQGDPPRWVGAGEWALHELLTRVPVSARAGLDGADEAAAVEAAAHWRDVGRLRALAAGLEGRPSGRTASVLLARLLAERGEVSAARVAADRATEQGGGPAVAQLAARLQQPVPPAAPELQLPARLEVSWSSNLVVDRIGRGNPFTAGPDYGEAPVAPIVPVVSEGIAFVSDSVSVSALDVLSGRVVWHHAGPLELVAGEGRASRSFGFDTYVDGWRPRAVSPYQCCQPVIDGGMVFTTVQVAEERRETHEFDGIPINWPLPRRRLVALDAGTGALRWRQERPDDGPDAFCNRFDVAGPPAVGGGTVYAAGSISEGAVSSYVAAFDERTGDLTWKTLLCSGQQDLTMFNRPFQEHTASPPLLAEGALYVVTNLGLAASLDAFSGRVRWLAGYEATARRASRSPERDVRRDVTVLNRPPQIEAGRLVIAPLDASEVTLLDPQTGRGAGALEPRRGHLRDVRHDVIATGDGRLLVIGESSVECFDAASGALRWTSLLDLGRDDRLDGAATLVGHHLLLPALSAGLLDLDIDAPNGPRSRPWTGPVAQRGVRRAVPAGRALLLTDNAWIHGVVDVEAALAEALAAAGRSPGSRLAAAELLLSKGQQDMGQLGEASRHFEIVLADGPPELADRARSGWLSAATLAARERGDEPGWQALLDGATRLGDPWSVAPEALAALESLGALEAVDAALADLAALDGNRALDLGPLTPDGSQPVALVLALRMLPRDDPPQAVARLQSLIERWPGRLWDGVPVRVAAAHRIADLIAEHGRGIYEPFERQAEAALAAGGGPVPASLAAVEARFPNARAVAGARLAALRQRLDAGEVRPVFEELSEVAGAGRDPDLRALRAEAARSLGEQAFADALLGLPEAAPPPELFALPGEGASRRALQISNRSVLIRFPTVAGSLGPERQACVVGAIDGAGELFLLDTETGELRWRRPMPGSPAASSRDAADFLSDGRSLFVQVYRQGPGGGVPPTDLVEAIALDDGATRWSAEMPGDSRAAALAHGLLLRLCAATDGSHRFRVEGFGAATGARALTADLPASVEARLAVAGGHVVVFTAGDVIGSPGAARVSVLDVTDGSLAASAPLTGEVPSLVMSLDEPPLILLSQRPKASSVATELLAFDPASRTVAWRSEPLPSMVSRQWLFPTGGGRLVLFSSPNVAGGRPKTVLTPIDARTGLLPPASTGKTLAVLYGQARGTVPRLVLSDLDDATRLFIADGAGGQLRFEVQLPPPGSGNLRVLHGRDGFLLVQEPLVRDQTTATLRVFDAATGGERYSTVVSGLRAPGRPDVALAEGCVLLASGGTVIVIRNATP